MPVFLGGGYISIVRARLKNNNFSLIASNCNGGFIYKDLGVRFNSPFVNLFIKADDFIKLCKDLRGYLEEELVFVKEFDYVYGNISYPTAYLKDVKIYFMHYTSEKDARDAWNRRKARIDWDNLYFIFTDRSGCTYKILEEFDALPLKHKIVFTHIPYPEIKSSVYIKGYEFEDKVGILSEFKNKDFPIKRMYEQFDIVGWLNER